MKAALCSQTCFVCTFGLINTKAFFSSPLSSYWCGVIKGGDALVVLLRNQLVKITLRVLGKANGEGWMVRGGEEVGML